MSEHEIGEREGKVISTMSGYLMSIGKWKENAQKAVKKGILRQDIYDKVIEYIEYNVSTADKCWKEIRELDGEDWKSYKRIITEMNDGKYFSEEARDLYSDYGVNSWGDGVINVKPDIERAVRGYVSSTLSKRYEAMCKDLRMGARAKKKEDAEAKYQRIRKLFRMPNIEGVPTLEKFLEDWKEDYINYFTDEKNIEEAEEAYQKAKREYVDYEKTKREEDHSWRSWHDEKYHRLSDRYSEKYSEYKMFLRSKEEIKKDAESGANSMEYKFITAVYDYSGEIESVNLYIGKGGNLNGGVVGKDGREWNVRTILAGGYNIQCLHLRTIVKERK